MGTNSFTAQSANEFEVLLLVLEIASVSKLGPCKGGFRYHVLYKNIAVTLSDKCILSE